MVAPHSSYQAIIPKEFHSSPIASHSGFLHTYKRVRQLFYSKSMKNFIKKFVTECDVCQRHKSEIVATPGLLQPLPIPDATWTNISMDFIDSLPSSQGKSTILVVVDRLTKYAHFCALRHPYTATSVARIFVENIAKLHGSVRIKSTKRGRVN